MLAFSYDEDELQTCAALPRTDTPACLSLFSQHQQHYNRSGIKEIRMNRFLDSVTFVYSHNYMITKPHFHVTLNQFSDCEQHELPIYDTDFYSPSFSSMDAQNTQSSQTLPLFGDDISSQHIQELSRENLKVDSSTGPVWISASNIRAFRTSREEDGNKKDPSLVQSHDALGDFIPDPMNKDWTQYLNWATAENPDGVPIVHPSLDQGTCGSCWAFSAIGSLEANISRHAAFAAYWSVIEKHHLQKSLDTIPPDIHQEAVMAAQKTERTAIQQTMLSIQELVDCDTQFDQGCTGGNPLLAYPFIRRYGLVSQSTYPYQGTQSKCHKHLLSNPTATVESWGLIVPKSEANMELVLRTLGPIAVGLDGNDPSFLSYKGGIFDSENCSRHHPNHAMLIVGMGEEYDEESGETIKYWIARNSWGPGWGESGYIRMRRRKGLGSSGVCGIALNPSVALGGSLVNRNREVSRWQLAPSGLNASNAAIELMNMNEGSECIGILCPREAMLNLVQIYINGCSKVLIETGFIFMFMMIALLIGSRIRKLKTRINHSKKTYAGDSTIILDVAVEEKSAFIPGHDTRNTSYGTIV